MAKFCEQIMVPDRGNMRILLQYLPCFYSCNLHGKQKFYWRLSLYVRSIFNGLFYSGRQFKNLLTSLQDVPTPLRPHRHRTQSLRGHQSPGSKSHHDSNYLGPQDQWFLDWNRKTRRSHISQSAGHRTLPWECIYFFRGKTRTLKSFVLVGRCCHGDLLSVEAVLWKTPASLWQWPVPRAGLAPLSVLDTPDMQTLESIAAMFFLEKTRVQEPPSCLAMQDDIPQWYGRSICELCSN